MPNLTALEDPGVGESMSVQLDNSLGANTIALPASGIVLSDTLPDDPALYFFEIFLQAIAVDAFASDGLSFKPGLALHCGFDF